jgi:hypothetical protein
MVASLHRAGLRVGMDVVYKPILDRIVPGYYHRLDPAGGIERSTCCDNTATENLMMGKLMIDSVALWARQYRIDSFRFDLMGHQPRATLVALQERVNKAAGRKVLLIGEGWNFGAVAAGAHIVQASQRSLDRTGIRGSVGDAGEAMIRKQGYINGLVYDPNAQAGERPVADLMHAADMVRAGLAGSIRSYPLVTWQDRTRQLQDLDDGGQPAGYASEPGEVVNYVENHDHMTLFDIDVLKLPLATSTPDRARVQVLGMALGAFSQGVACFHAGIDLLRIRASSTLFRMRSADEIRQRLRFFNTGSQQEPTVIAAHLDGRGYPGAGYPGIRYFVNVDRVAHVVSDPQARGKRMRLHPVHLAPGAADKRAASAGYDSSAGRFSIPPHTAVVFVEGEAARAVAKRSAHANSNRKQRVGWAPRAHANAGGPRT